MAALVSVMVMVSVATMNWDSIRPKTLRHSPIRETLIMAFTVVVTVATGNLALGVGAGSTLALTLSVTERLRSTRERP